MTQQIFYGSHGLVDVQATTNRPEQPLKRWNAKGNCRRCGERTTALGRLVTVRALDRWTEALQVADGRLYAVDNGLAYLSCRGCGCTRIAMSVLGKARDDRPCDARCMGATGHDCDCSCKGHNHGKAFSL